MIFDFMIILWALICGALVQLASIIWYGTYLFGAAWRKAQRKKPEAQIPLKLHIISFGGWVLSALILGLLFWVLGIHALIDHVLLAVLVFVAVGVPQKVMSVFYNAHSRSLIAIDAGFGLIAYSLIAVIFAVF